MDRLLNVRYSILRTHQQMSKMQNAATWLTIFGAVPCYAIGAPDRGALTCLIWCSLGYAFSNRFEVKCDELAILTKQAEDAIALRDAEKAATLEAKMRALL